MAKTYVPGVPCWVDLASPDPGRAAAFYGTVFGWQFEDLSSDGDGTYRWARLDGVDVAGIAGTGVGPASWRTFVRVDDADRAATEAIAKGGAAVERDLTVPPDGRALMLTDPAGAGVGVWAPSAHPGAQLVNAPGTWNFNTLRTPDLDAAETFYGAVFGWRVAAADFGGSTATMLCLPGYGDVVDADNPGWKKGHEEGGSPAGFTDIVAWLETAPAPARWGVEFNVHDTRATVDTALAVGGQVLRAPTEGFGMWSAALVDPLGAEFSINDFGSA
ncbi:VOC family protein [Georgenia yuyongxinii]|uniref:VOC family protein n=1 Tax=Georgenia yuyongxinii TaxID=2589797 RepID=A0A5B8C3R0_9MICO|nr:VOC family protein [Georgenia yuyongxinii]QDC25253.1 VOC family protein [Georgenia yuyongxinii]